MDKSVGDRIIGAFENDDVRDKTPEEMAEVGGLMPPPIKYPNNILESFGTGALLDLRVRMAIGFLNTSPIFSNVQHSRSEEELDRLPKQCALMALDLATELMAEAERRGLVEPIPESDEIGDQLRKQAKRSASYNALMQIEGNKFIQAEQSRLSSPFPLAPGARGPGRH